MFQEVFDKIIAYVIGTPTKALGFVYLMLGVNTLIATFGKKKLWAVIRENLELAVAYLAFIILGNIIDKLEVSELMGWTGSVQPLICLALLAREIRKLTTYLGNKYGIVVPILNERVDRMAGGATSTTPEGPTVPQASKLHQDLQQLETEPDPTEAKRFPEEP